MLGILVSYASFHQFETLQRKNIERFVKCPYKLYICHTSLHGNPSLGHMLTLNSLLDQAWEECDSFLFFDNDMIFLTEFYEPMEDCWYLPQDRSGIHYAWANLLYFKKHPLMKTIGFEHNTDSGGSTWKYLAETPNKKIIPFDADGFEEYKNDVDRLNKEYKRGSWNERFHLNGSQIYHFRAMSNWTKYEEEYMKKKEKLILYHVSKLIDE